MTTAETFARSVLARHSQAGGLFERLEAERPAFEADGTWAEWCALPYMSAQYVLRCEQMLPGAPKAPESESGALAAAWLWMKAKQIFCFDQTLYDALADQPIDGDIPVEILKRLPVPCVYIANPIPAVYGAENPSIGFFAWLVYNGDTATTFLSLLPLFKGGTAPKEMLCPLIGSLKSSFGDIKKSMMEKFSGRFVDATDEEIEAETDRLLEGYTAALRVAINLLLYLCADDPDFSTAPRRVSAKPRQTGFTPERPPRKASVCMVGERIGATIRKGYAAVPPEATRPLSPATHASPVPHMRRAHWHHFWVGAKVSPDRRLVLRWVPPVFVGDKGEDYPATIHRVKGADKR